MTQRALLYARVSSDDRGQEGRNLAGQLDMCREYANGRGWRVVGELAEDDRGASGATFELPELQRILSLAESGAIDVVVTREIDRLSRTLVKQLVVEARLRELDVEIDYVMGSYPDTPEGNLNKLVRAVISEFEREKIKERMTRGRYQKVKSGQVICYGNPAYGYREVTEDGRTLLHIHEPEAEVVRQIYDRYIAGDSLNDIAQKLTKRGIPTRDDTLIRFGIKRLPHGHWPRSTIRAMLRNETYAGTWRYGKRQVEVQVPAIIAPDAWASVQALLTENRARSGRSATHQYLFSRRVTCGVCGRPAGGRATRRPGFVSLHYRCSSKDKPRPRPECDSAWFPADRVDERVWELMAKLATDSGVLEEVIDRLTQTVPDTTGLESEIARAAEAVEAKRRQRDRLLDVYLSGTFGLDELEQRRSAIEDEIAGAEAAHLQLVERLESEVPIDPMGLNLFQELRDAIMAADFDARRELVEELNIRLTLEGRGKERRVLIGALGLEGVGEVGVGTKR